MLQFRLYTQTDLLKMPPIIIASMDDTSLCYWKVLHPYFIAISKLLYGTCYWIQKWISFIVISNTPVFYTVYQNWTCSSEWSTIYPVFRPFPGMFKPCSAINVFFSYTLKIKIPIKTETNCICIWWSTVTYMINICILFRDQVCDVYDIIIFKITQTTLYVESGLGC